MSAFKIANLQEKFLTLVSKRQIQEPTARFRRPFGSAVGRNPIEFGQRVVGNLVQIQAVYVYLSVSREA